MRAPSLVNKFPSLKNGRNLTRSGWNTAKGDTHSYPALDRPSVLEADVFRSDAGRAGEAPGGYRRRAKIRGDAVGKSIRKGRGHRSLVAQSPGRDLSRAGGNAAPMDRRTNGKNRRSTAQFS